MQYCIHRAHQADACTAQIPFQFMVKKGLKIMEIVLYSKGEMAIANIRDISGTLHYLPSSL